MCAMIKQKKQTQNYSSYKIISHERQVHHHSDSHRYQWYTQQELRTLKVSSSSKQPRKVAFLFSLFTFQILFGVYCLTLVYCLQFTVLCNLRLQRPLRLSASSAYSAYSAFISVPLRPLRFFARFAFQKNAAPATCFY